MEACLEGGGSVIGVLADNLERTLRDPVFRSAVGDGRLALVSAVHPKAPFTVANAMARNNLIYCLAQYGLVIAASLEKGGTRAGALEALKHRWVPLFVRSNETAPAGNHDLIKQGALPFPAEPAPGELTAWLESEAKGWKTGPASAGRKAIRPRKPESPDLDDLFPVVWPHIASRLAKWPTAKELALHLQVGQEQTLAWLEKAVSQGLAARTPGTDRFVLAGSTEARQQRFDIG